MVGQTEAITVLTATASLILRQVDQPVFEGDALTNGDWLRAGGIVLTSIAVAVAANRLARSVLSRMHGSGMAAIITARLIGYLLVLVGLVYALNTLGVRVGPLLGALGLGGLVLALALQKVVENFVGALILQTRRPFTVGDTVTLGDQTGVVTDIDSRTTVLLGLDGTMVRIPNGTVLASTIVNLTRSPIRRSELTVGVAYDTNLDIATATLNEALPRVQRVLRDPAPLVVLRGFGSSSIDFTIFYWHASDIPSELSAKHDLMLAIHHAFADDQITIAFPQVVVWPAHEATSNPYHQAPGAVFTPRSHESAAAKPSEMGWWARRRSDGPTPDQE